MRAIWLLAGLSTCAWAWGAEHRYRVVVDPALSEVQVRAELDGPVAWLGARDGAVSRLTDPATCDGRPLTVRRARIVMRHASCVRYRYPLAPADTYRGPPVAAGVVVSAPSQWLWIPPLGAADRVRIELVMPADMRASVPWRALGSGEFELAPSPESSRATVAFGAFAQYAIDLPGAQMRVALIDGPGRRLEAAAIVAWLRAAADEVAAVSGRFPNPAIQVIVQPSDPRGWAAQGWDDGGSAVPFGYVSRDGGEAVRFFVAPDRPLADYLSDWTATHEFSHLLLPYVRSRDKWISEGFASYYQNVLLARCGVYSEQAAWQRLHRAFENARAISDPPALNRVSDRPFREVRMLIYWSGAAIALMADTELRRLSDSAESLDTVLARLQACCLPSQRAWSGQELFAKLDELSKYPVFADLYRRYAFNRGMPPLAETYSRLGVVPTGSSSVALNNAAPDAEIRGAIMGTDS